MKKLPYRIVDSFHYDMPHRIDAITQSLYDIPPGGSGYVTYFSYPGNNIAITAGAGNQHINRSLQPLW
jgi:hypothetical protein